MKSTILIIILIILASSVSATSHFLVVDDNSPATDVLKMNGVTTFLIQEGETSNSYLSSEMPTASEDVMTVFIYFGEVVINYPSNYKNLANKIQYFEEKYNIDAELKPIEETIGIALIEQIPEEALPQEAKDILYFNNLMISPLIIYGEYDLETSNIFSYESQKEKKFNEVLANELLGSHLLIIGGPCANEYWELYSSET